MQARYYDPVIGRFYSNDPVGFTNVHTFNRYAYANNNPYKYTDPDGRETNPVNGFPFITTSELRSNSFNSNVGKFGNSRSASNWNGGYHNGVDIKAPNGTTLVAPTSGYVTTTKNNKGGNVIYISTKNSDGQTVTIGMAHLESLNVKTGDTVKEGDNIGSAGSTGNAKGTPKSEEHVHLTVTVAGEKMNPQEHFAKAQIEKDK